jgi:hypothetical protein
MNMPGFTAGASLSEASHRYRGAGLVWQPSEASQAIYPAQSCVGACFYAECGPRAMFCAPSQKAETLAYCRWKCLGGEF